MPATVTGVESLCPLFEVGESSHSHFGGQNTLFCPIWMLRELPCKQDADKSESGTLEGEEFVLFYKALTQREEVLSLFREYSEDGKKLTLLELADFLREEQLEDEGTEELAMELIDKYEPSETGESGLRHQLCLGARKGHKLTVPWRKRSQPQPGINRHKRKTHKV